jgi:hypothetical protein
MQTSSSCDEKHDAEFNRQRSRNRRLNEMQGKEMHTFRYSFFSSSKELR